MPGDSDRVMPVPQEHFVFGTPMEFELAEDQEQILFAMGCFWGAERCFWQLDGVVNTAVGYTAGQTHHPTYEAVCSGRSGHTEAVRVVHDTASISTARLLEVFWESHDPTQGMRQGNDTGTQYRSGIYTFTDEQLRLANDSRGRYQERLSAAGLGDITTEIIAATTFYYAEEYHQQYLAKNPGGYCGLGGTGIGCGG